MRTYRRLLVTSMCRAFRARRDLMLENLALRQQPAVYVRQSRRPQLHDADRRFWSLLARPWSGWRSALVIVGPDTVVRWHRAAWRGSWPWRSRARRPGRPRIGPELRELITRIATECPRWSALRIQGELLALGYEVSAETVRRYRRQALRHPPSQFWRSFLANHRPQLWAADFFTVHTLTFKTLFVFFFIAHERRRIVHVAVTAHPTARWVWPQLVEAAPWGKQPHHLIRDRDRSYGGDFIQRARAIGIETVLIPVQAPKANAIAERVVGTHRRECLDHLIIVNERHLRSLLREYVTHYNHVRPHQSLAAQAPDDRRPRPRAAPPARAAAAPPPGRLGSASAPGPGPSRPSGRVRAAPRPSQSPTTPHRRLLASRYVQTHRRPRHANGKGLERPTTPPAVMSPGRLAGHGLEEGLSVRLGSSAHPRAAPHQPNQRLIPSH